MKNITLTVILLVFAHLASAQTSRLEIHSKINLPKDSIESERLLSSLNQFLISIQSDSNEYEWIYTPHLIQTAVLLGEIEHIEKNDDEKSFYKPHLMNLIPVENGQYFVQVSYIGMDKQNPIIRAHVELVAHQVGKKYLFSSPLVRNTQSWNSTVIDNLTCYYRDTMNMQKAKEYQELATFYDLQLGAATHDVIFYFFDDDLEVQQFFGLPYMLDYNGEGGSVGWGLTLDNQEIYLVNEKALIAFDPHDLWHNRLGKVKSRREVNHAVDEAIATLYGGSWGLSWQEMFIAFQDQIEIGKNTDWLKHRKQQTFFETSGHKNPTDFMINALFVKNIESEKGFAGVLELLDAKEEEAYFLTLEKLTGITKRNYNREVWRLLKKEMGVLQM